MEQIFIFNQEDKTITIKEKITTVVQHVIFSNGFEIHKKEKEVKTDRILWNKLSNLINK